ncbi:hypothetical protein BU14_0271s0008 [Porphyra umbilicalis]|uniref:Uncharacterized protein n=1 Tax=Porphyra umbilicalis TaxID=2786 RepID=A0A1X6P257_PORUM|nr:hypothetical protein BU14_0271s0008 [Porphyra umbilicalis]|eukprot:OSX74713.1 hypothetical protein BU14_0271s0008 [Porphyra umbilicalis]
MMLLLCLALIFPLLFVYFLATDRAISVVLVILWCCSVSEPHSPPLSDLLLSVVMISSLIK